MPRILNGHLTAGQLAALRLAANGMTAGQIARRLGTTETGIHLRLNQAARSMGATSRPHLVALALVRGLLTADDIHQPNTPREHAA